MEFVFPSLLYPLDLCILNRSRYTWYQSLEKARAGCCKPRRLLTIALRRPLLFEFYLGCPIDMISPRKELSLSGHKAPQ